jgi:uncharacterized delta-60 repeat protein
VNLEYCCSNQRGPQAFSLGASGEPGILENINSSNDILAMATGPGAMIAVGKGGLIRRYPTIVSPEAPAVVASDGYARAGTDFSAAMINGRPAIAFGDDKYTAIKYIRAADAGGTSWEPPVIVDNAAPVGKKVCLASVNGNPAVCYYDLKRRGIKYRRAMDAAGGVWGPPVLLDTGDFTPGDYSLEIIDGNPAVCVVDGQSLRFVRAADVSGSVWGELTYVDATGSFDRCTIKTVQGYPAIAYAGDGGLWYRRAVDSRGVAWDARASVSVSGSNPSMQIVNGRPALSFYAAASGGTNGALRYSRAADLMGAAWNPPVTLDSAGNPGLYQSLAIVAGKPAIGYYAFTTGDLRYIRSTDASGDTAAAWGSPLTVDSTGDVGSFASLLDVGDGPALVFHDDTQGSLRYVRPTEESGGTLWPVDIVVEAPAGSPVADDGARDLGIVPVGTSKSIDFTVRNPNSGSMELTIQSLTLDGPDAAEFSITVPPRETTLPSGAATDITVTYAPVAPGIKHATLHLVSNANGSRNHYDILLSAASVPDITVEQSEGTLLRDGQSMIFPLTAPGNFRDLVLTVRNPGGAVLSGLEVTFLGANSEDFFVTSAPAPAVAPGASTSFTVRHAPRTTGAKLVTVRLANNLSGSRNPFTLNIMTIPGLPDESFKPVSGAVTGIALQANGRILTAGADGLSNFNADGTSNTSFFAPAINGGTVDCVAVQKDGRILMGGSFQRVNGRSLPGLARITEDGSLDESFVPGLSPGVSCIAIQPDSKIIIGGNFQTIGGTAHPWLARLRPDGSLDTGFQPVLNNAVSCLALQPDGKILMGGRFTGSPRDRLARLNPDGTGDVSFAPFPGTKEFLSIVLQANGNVLAGNTDSMVQRLLPNGNGAGSISFFSGGIHDLALQADGKCLTALRNGFSRLSEDGGREIFFNFSVSASLLPSSPGLAVQEDGKVIIAGSFSTSAGSRNLARLHNEPAFTELKTVGNSTVRWLRGGAAPEVWDVTVDVKPDNSPDWMPLGAAQRISGGWELTGLTLPASGSIRAQARAGNSVMETVTPILTPLEYWRRHYFGAPANTGDAADNADPDQDGLTNFTEFAFGLSPVDRGSSALPPFVRSGETFTASFTAPAETDGVVYGAEWSPSMLPGAWTKIPDTGEGEIHTFSAPAGGERIFVRYTLKAR